MIGGGTGPGTGTNATTCTPGAWNLARMLQAADAYPVNLGFLGKGNASGMRRPAASRSHAGAIGLKLHEDWGTTPAAIDACLRVADELDVQVAIHTDTLNEAGFVEDTIRAIAGRTIHTYHTEGAGGGHAPDIIKIAGLSQYPAVLDQPTRPFTVNTIQEHLDMLMVCHHLSPGRSGRPGVRRDAHPARDDRRRGHPARPGRDQHDVLRFAGDGPRRRSDPAHLADGAQDEGPARSARRRAIRRGTTTPASSATSPSTPSIRRSRTASHIWSARIEPGKLADLVLWKPAFFGVKPELVLKGGMIACAAMGDPNASIPTPQPVLYRPMFAAATPRSTCVTFVSIGRRWSARCRASWGCRNARRGRAPHARAGQARHGGELGDAVDRGRSADVRGVR